MDNLRRFERIETPEEQQVERQLGVADRAAAGALALAFKALSQRALAGVRDLFALCSVGSIFWLWWSIPDPNILQIVSLSIYAVIILAANIIVRRY